LEGMQAMAAMVAMLAGTAEEENSRLQAEGSVCSSRWNTTPRSKAESQQVLQASTRSGGLPGACKT
jgi:hypothetical protein